MLLWIEFLAATVVILAAGWRLTRYGDIIAEKAGLSRLWLGMALMAAVTSLPELATGISAVLTADVPDIAAGNIMGSCVFNVFILGLLDTLSRKIPLSAKSHQGNIFSAGMSLIFLGGVAVCLYLGAAFPRLGWVGLYTPAILVLYLATMRMAFKFEKRRAPKAAAGEATAAYARTTLKQAILRYILNAAFVVGAAVFLPSIADGIAKQTGLGQTFVGNIFVAISTSLPELVVSISAVRLGAIDMAVGNIFGSNLFNMAILALEDLLYFKGPLLSFVQSQHFIPTLMAMAMTGLAIAGLIYNAGKKYFLWAWDSFGIILLYLANLGLLYFLR